MRPRSPEGDLRPEDLMVSGRGSSAARRTSIATPRSDRHVRTSSTASLHGPTRRAANDAAATSRMAHSPSVRADVGTLATPKPRPSMTKSISRTQMAPPRATPVRLSETPAKTSNAPSAMQLLRAQMEALSTRLNQAASPASRAPSLVRRLDLAPVLATPTPRARGRQGRGIHSVQVSVALRYPYR